VKWSVDGRGLFALYAPALALENNTTLSYLDLRGKATKLWISKGFARTLHVVPSPDGKHIAFALSAMNSNVWLVEKF
jgi:hypothetical protein